MSTILCNTVSTRTHLGAEGEPKWNVILPFGKAWHPQAPNEELNVTAEFCERMIANWREAGGQGVQVNYFHKGRSNIPAPIDDKIAGAWMEDFRVGADGLEALMRYTPRARGYIANDELRYFSIELDLNGVSLRSGQRVGPCIRGGALLNDPHFTNLPRLAASFLPASPPKEPHMNRKQLLAALGLSEDATQEQINAALSQFGLAASATPDATTLQAAIASATDPLVASVKKLSAELEASRASEQKLTATVKELVEREATARIDAALVELAPHFLPANADSVRKTLVAMGIDAGRALVASWPKVRPMKGEMGHDKPGDLGLPESGAPLDAAAAVAEVEKLVTAYQAEHKVSEVDARIAVLMDPKHKAVVAKGWITSSAR